MLNLKLLQAGTKKLRGTITKVKPKEVGLYFHKGVFFAKAKTVGDSGRIYRPSIEWPVEYTFDKSQAKSSYAKAKTKKSEKLYYKPPTMQTSCRVRCNCTDFKFTFAPTLTSKGSLRGNLITFPKPKGTGTPRNPDHIPGMCKHLNGLVDYLKRKGKLK